MLNHVKIAKSRLWYSAHSHESDVLDGSRYDYGGLTHTKRVLRRVIFYPLRSTITFQPPSGGYKGQVFIIDR